MSAKFVLFVVLGMLVGTVLVACTLLPAQPVSTVRSLPEEETTSVDLADATVDPVAAVVLGMVERVNAEDYAGAAELVADDMVAYLVGMPPTGMEIYWGREQFQRFLEECCTGQHFVWEVVPERVEDGVVYAESKTWMDFTRQLGVAPNSWHEIFVVDDGKVSLYVSILAEEALTVFKPAIFEAMPELAMAVQPPAATNETPASEINVVIADGTCAYDGPMTFQAGKLIVNVAVQDDRFDGYALSFFTLDEDKDLIDLMASTFNVGPPSWSDTVFLKVLAPGESQTYNTFSVDEGLLYMVCWGGPPDVAIGNAGPFVVKQ